MWFLLLILIGIPSASANKIAQGEYYRLSHEMNKLAQRGAWSGVERAYHAVEGIGLPLSFDDHLRGANAARARGDIATTRARLMAAHTQREDRQVIEWLWRIDEGYGTAVLRTEGPGTLERTGASFLPEELAAVAFAQRQLAEAGAFSGYLPAGTYTLDGERFDVAPRTAVEVTATQERRRRARKRPRT